MGGQPGWTGRSGSRLRSFDLISSNRLQGNIMSDSAAPIKVQILGKEYPIACSAEEQHDLLMAARYVDEKTREIRDNGRIIGTERIAVMAALNIAHELLQQKKQGNAD